MSGFSQRTLGILRDILTDMEPKKATSNYVINEFWQKALFDFEFPQRVIRIMQSHNFDWVNIIPNLSDETLGNNYSSSDDALSLGEHDQILHNLIFFALEKSGSPKIPEFKQALGADGFKLPASPAVDLNIPKELSDLPNADVMRIDVRERLKSGGLVALLFIDLDNFKSVNDQLGSHAEGDKCLVRAVKAISAAIIHKGKLYRRSGDEFIVVLPNFDSREATAVAERIRIAIDDAKTGGAVSVTASIGVATSQSDGVTDAASLEDLADTKMYEAKKTKNRVVS